MKVACVAYAHEIGTENPGLIVFPEYCDPREVADAVRQYPNAIIVAADEIRRRSRALVLHSGRNHIRYFKFGSDGRTIGTGELPDVLPAVETPKICVGVLICMDVQCGGLVQALVRRVESSTSPIKLICIPAFMGSEWFSSPETNPPLNRVHIALCNHPVQDRPRCKSFIADATGEKVCRQSDREPIFWQIA